MIFIDLHQDYTTPPEIIFHRLDTACVGTLAAKFLRPLLEEFKKRNKSYPHDFTPEDWDNIIQFMIDAFILIEKDDRWSWTEEDRETVVLGLKYFSEFYLDLWS